MVNFNPPVVQIAGKTLKCTNRQEWVLDSKVKAPKKVTILYQSEFFITRQLAGQNFWFLRLVEGRELSTAIATSLNHLQRKAMWLSDV